MVLIVRRRIPLLVLGLIAVAIAYPVSRRLKFDRSIASMFAPSDESFLAYQELQESFGGNSVVMLVYRDRDLTSVEGMQRNRQITQRVSEVEGVEGVISPSVLSDAIKKFQPPILFATKQPNLFRKGDPVAAGFDELFAGYTHSQDHSRAAVVAMLRPGHSPETIEQLARITREFPPELGEVSDGVLIVDEAVIVGEPVLVHDGFSLIERDGARLATMTVLLLSLVVLVSLVDLRFVLLTAMLIGGAVAITKAILVLIGIHLSLVSTILTAIVTVIAVTAVLHLGVRFRSARSRGYSSERSAIAAFTLLLLPIIWTCATDAAGFAALSASQILPIRQFGWMIAIAASVVCILILVFAPATMMLPGFRLSPRLQLWQHLATHRMRRRCVRLAGLSIDHPRWCASVSIVFAMIAIVGIGRSETETSFLNNFRPGSPVVRAYRLVETEFGGAGVWDVLLDAPVDLTEEYLAQVRDLERELREINLDGVQLTKVLSLADADEITSRSPLSSIFSSSSRLSAMYLAMPVFFDALLSSPKDGKRKLRIMLRSHEQLDAPEKMALIAAVESTVRQRVSSESWQATCRSESPGKVTGYYVLMSRLIHQVVSDQWRCFLFSGLLVWVLLGMATRSIRLATAALLPNLLPIFFVLGCVGLSGGKINMGAAMIAAVSIGLSIDGSVHFLASYQRSRGRGNGPTDSARHAAGNIGVPVLLATAALVVGFGVLATSDFIPTATFGILVASTLVLGTAVNLTLLPAIVVQFDPEKGSGTKRANETKSHAP